MHAITSRLYSRLHQGQLPLFFLIALLQRTPVLRLLVSSESVWVGSNLGYLLRSAAVVGVTVGAVDTLAGATTMTANPASPAAATVGVAFSATFAVTGAPTPAESYTITSLPPGLTVPNSTVLGNALLLNGLTGTITGTPTTAGNYTAKITVWEFLDATGNNKTFNYIINVANGSATAPSITTQPASQSVTAGGSATFSVTAAGTAPLTYQWRKGGVAISGATNASYTIASTVTGDAGTYSVVATNSAGSATSNGATLTVNAAVVAPSITTQPTNQSVTAGGAATFSVTAAGTAPLTYQWRKDAAAISGATSASYAIASTVTGDAGTYTVVVTNSAGSVTSNGATLTVSAGAVAPSITTQPTSQSVTTGGSATFSVTAAGTAPLTYQWRKGGVAISGATNASYTIASTVTGDAGTYSVVVTNSAGSATSNGATLTVSAGAVAPSITTQPSSQSVTTGGSATFSVTAAGTAPLTYQWRKDAAGISGATSASYAIASTVTGDAGTYTVVVTNSAGSVTSNGATLTVSAGAVAPSITTQPVALAANVGASATFSVTAAGTAPLTYQWRRNGAAISGATNATLALSSITVDSAGGYSVIVTNSAGSVTSAEVLLTVNLSTGPVITSALASQTVTASHNSSFAAQTFSSATYQWQVSTNGGSSWANIANGSLYSGATTSTLTITGATVAMDGYRYRYVVTTSGGTTTSGGAILSVAVAIFSLPTGIGLDAGGNLYVCDTTGNNIQKVTTAGVVTVLAGSSGTAGSSDGSGTAARFNQPGGVVVTAAGVVYVADTANATIRKITASGVVTTFAGSASTRGESDSDGTSATFASPVGLAVDSDGNLYVADAGNNTIRKVTSSGGVSTFAGHSGSTGSADGTGKAAMFNHPTGVAVDLTGNVYVADTTNNTIRKITPAGVVTTLAGVVGISGASDGRGSAALFNQPGGLAIDGAGNVYVADVGNSTIRKVTPAGVVTTVAGLPTVAGFEDGTGFAALFNQPKALIVDAAGNVFVADTGNAALRKVSSAGAVLTLTLSQGAASTDGTGGSSSGGGSTGSAASPSGGASGGGGALSGWLVGALACLALCRWRRGAAQM